MNQDSGVNPIAEAPSGIGHGLGGRVPGNGPTAPVILFSDASSVEEDFLSTGLGASIIIFIYISLHLFDSSCVRSLISSCVLMLASDILSAEVMLDFALICYCCGLGEYCVPFGGYSPMLCLVLRSE